MGCTGKQQVVHGLHGQEAGGAWRRSMYIPWLLEETVTARLLPLLSVAEHGLPY